VTNEKEKDKENKHQQNDHHCGKPPAHEERARQTQHGKHDEKAAGHSPGQADEAGDDPRTASKDSGNGGKPKVHTDEEYAALNDRLIRLLADFDNFRKRVVRTQTDLIQRANEDIMKELLPALDHLDLAIEAAKTSDVKGPVIDGFKMVGEQFTDILGKFGLSSFDGLGNPFDPSLR
jgi:molecular chaperone GrpE